MKDKVRGGCKDCESCAQGSALADLGPIVNRCPRCHHVHDFVDHKLPPEIQKIFRDTIKEDYE